MDPDTLTLAIQAGEIPDPLATIRRIDARAALAMATLAMSHHALSFGRAICALCPLLLATLNPPAPSQACDICAIYTATELQEGRTGPRIGVAEQFTHFGTLQQDGERIPNPNEECLDSSITQLLVSFGWTSRFLLQLNTPVIHRGFQRGTEAGTERGTESGVGDISVHAIATVFHTVNETSVHRLSCSLGVKLPTGSPERLKEELADTPDHVEPEVPPVFRSVTLRPRHSTTGALSGIHGHDLALGTGSTDVILGAQWLGTYRRFYGTASLQYFIRTVGSYGYRYSNETILSGGPGLFLLTRHDTTLGFQSLLTLDTKGTDSLNGERVGDTGATFLYAGPALHWTWRSSLSADFALDIPAVRNNTAVQIVPDFRLRGGVVWRF
ncbi:MAG: hypothetical protein N3C12_10905 [Candidatus Binatia bacterium]|nr:hypothetical protein [Candidatus Binatia bacterium]